MPRVKSDDVPIFCDVRIRTRHVVSKVVPSLRVSEDLDTVKLQSVHHCVVTVLEL